MLAIAAEIAKPRGFSDIAAGADGNVGIVGSE